MISAALMLFAAAIAANGTPPGGDDGARFDYREAVRCSERLRVDAALTGEARRRCLIAVAATYIELEQNRLPAEQMLIADDVSRHALGTEADFRPGNRARMMADRNHSVISAIRNRRWSVDGDEVWIVYDGYTKAAGDRPDFHVAERFTISEGLIREIMVAGVKRPEDAAR